MDPVPVQRTSKRNKQDKQKESSIPKFKGRIERFFFFLLRQPITSGRLTAETVKSPEPFQIRPTFWPGELHPRWQCWCE